MELTHEFTVPASLDAAWATFMDLERVGSCFPGATVTEVSDDAFSGQVKVKLGPIALVYTGSGSFVERDDAAHRAVLEAKGKDKRGNGTAGATVTVQLTPADAGTHVAVVTDLAITGKPAQFGRGVMQDVSDKLLGQFVACIEGQLAETGGEAANADAAPPAEPSAPAEAGDSVGAGSPGEAPGEAPAEVAPPPAPAPRAAPRPSATAPRPAATAPADDSLDLGATVLPVLLKTYLPYGVLAAVGIVIGYLIGRRRLR